MLKDSKNQLSWFITVLTITALMSVVSWLSNRVLIKNNQEAVIYNTTLDSLQETLIALQDVETGTRGYIMSGNESFLEPYSKGIKTWKIHFKVLTDNLKNNQEAEKRLDKLENYINLRIQSSKESIRIRKTKNFKVHNLLLKENNGKLAMDKARLEINTIYKTQKQELETKRKEAEVKSQIIIIVTVLIMFLYSAVSTVVPTLVKRRR